MAFVIERNDLAVDDRVRKVASFFCEGGEFLRPVESLASPERDFTILDPHLNAIAVELDFVCPAVTSRRPFDRRAKLRRNEVRKLYCAPAAGGFRHGALGCGLA